MLHFRTKVVAYVVTAVEQKVKSRKSLCVAPDRFDSWIVVRPSCMTSRICENFDYDAGTKQDKEGIATSVVFYLHPLAICRGDLAYIGRYQSVFSRHLGADLKWLSNLDDRDLNGEAA